MTSHYGMIIAATLAALVALAEVARDYTGARPIETEVTE